MYCLVGVISDYDDCIRGQGKHHITIMAKIGTPHFLDKNCVTAGRYGHNVLF